MKTDEDVGKKLLEAIQKVDIGGYIEFHSPMPGLTDEFVCAQLKFQEKNGAVQKWHFDLIWFEMLLGKASAKLVGNDLTFEVES